MSSSLHGFWWESNCHSKYVFLVDKLLFFSDWCLEIFVFSSQQFIYLFFLVQHWRALYIPGKHSTMEPNLQPSFILLCLCVNFFWVHPVLEFTQLFESVSLCLLPKLESFYHYFLSTFQLHLFLNSNSWKHLYWEVGKEEGTEYPLCRSQERATSHLGGRTHSLIQLIVLAAGV